MSKYLAAIINSFNHDVPIGNVLSPTYKIQNIVKSLNAKKDGYEYFDTIS